MKRRGFLGFLGASAVAGPSVAKKVAESAVTEIHPITSTPGLIDCLSPSGSLGETAEGLYSGKIQRISQLKKLISGEIEEKEDPYYVAQRDMMLSEHNINTLGSVSKSHKMRMMKNEAKRIKAARDNIYWIDELKRLTGLGD